MVLKSPLDLKIAKYVKEFLGVKTMHERLCSNNSRVPTARENPAHIVTLVGTNGDPTKK